MTTQWSIGHVGLLDSAEELQQFKIKKIKDKGVTGQDGQRPPDASDPVLTPEEQLGAAYEELRETLADDLLRRVRAGCPKFFEHLAFRLLLAIGYGKSQLERVRVSGKSGDEGIDCVIPQDRLSLTWSTCKPNGPEMPTRYPSRHLARGGDTGFVGKGTGRLDDSQANPTN